MVDVSLYTVCQVCVYISVGEQTQNILNTYVGKSLCAVVDFELAEDSLKAVRVFKFIQRQTSIPDQDSEAKEDMEIIAKHKDMLKGVFFVKKKNK